MSEDIAYKKLSPTIKELSTIESNEISLLIAIIKKNVVDIIDKNMSFLKDEFSSKCAYYGKNDADVNKEKEEILNGYEKELNKIALKFEEEYMNLALALQETQSNQKIAIANLKKVLESKKKYIESAEYKAFIKKVQEMEFKRENAETKSEFDAADNFLNNVSNPVENYNKKIDDFANKYVKYCGLEEEYIARLKKCNEKVEDTINSVMKYDTGKLAVINKKTVFSIFSKLLNKISGAKKFEKEYIDKKRENIKKIQIDTDNILSELDNEIDTTLISLDLYKAKITQAFNQAV